MRIRSNFHSNNNISFASASSRNPRESGTLEIENCCENSVCSREMEGEGEGFMAMQREVEFVLLLV